jgi:hypothetical protein
MRKFFPLLLVLALAACDSSDDGPSDAERFVGNWTVDRVISNSGTGSETDVTAGVLGASGVLSRLSASFADDGTVVLSADFRDAGQEDQSVAGTYEVQESISTIRLNISVPGTTTTFPVASRYSFDGDDAVSVTLPALVVNTILQAGGVEFQLEGNVGLRFVR